MEKEPKNELLTNKEAVVYQDYATKLEGKEFSEQSSIEAYKEAEELINQLRDNKDWTSIDWDKIDFNDIKQIKDLQARLDTAVKSVIQSQLESGNEQEKGVIKAISRFINEYPVSLAVLAAILIVAGVKNVIQDEAINTVSHDTETNDEVQDVSATSPKNRDELPRWHGIYVKENIQENTEELHITLQDGKKLRCVTFRSYGKDGEPDTMGGVSCDWE